MRVGFFNLACMLFLAILGCSGDQTPIDFTGIEQRVRGGDPQALAEMVEMLGHPTLGERVYSLILDVGTPAVPFLLGQVKASDDARREATLAALGALKAGAAAPAIAEVLADRALPRRYVAAWALGEIGRPEFAPALIEALDDPNREVRRSATRALIKIHRPAVKAMLAALPAASSEAAAGIIRALGDIGDGAALEALCVQAQKDNRAEAMLALGKLRAPRAVAALVNGLADPDWQVRMNAAMALGSTGAGEAAPALRRTLEDEVPVVREWSARSLEMITDERMFYRNAKGERVPPDNVYH